jgi:hypothetical protein
MIKRQKHTLKYENSRCLLLRVFLVQQGIYKNENQFLVYTMSISVYSGTDLVYTGISILIHARIPDVANPV